MTKPLPKVIEKGISESEGRFMQRLNKIATRAIAEARLEEHFDVDFTQKIQDKDESSLKKKKNKDLVSSKEETKRKKRKLKDEKRKAKSLKNKHRLVKQFEKQADSFNKKDNFRFGEVVHQPPTFKK